MEPSQGKGAALTIPAVASVVALLVLPVCLLVGESIREFTPGRVGATADAPLTLQNYAELAAPAYVGYFADTLRLSFIATALSVFLGLVIAHHVARMAPGARRKLWIAFLIAMVFLSALARVYAVSLTFGTVGLLPHVARLFNLNPNSGRMTEAIVVLGLLHFLIPIASLTLISTIQNINPRLVAAAQSLGASAAISHLTVTVPLSARGLVSSFLICFSLSISSFVIPMILGKGRVLFVSNLIYSRFGEVANYPSGAALSIIMLAIALVLTYGLTKLVAGRLQEG